MKKCCYHIAIFLGLILSNACTKEFDNPNVTEDELLKTPEGIVELIVGTKQRFAINSNFGNGSVYSGRSANALTTFEVKQRGGANQDLNQLSLGGKGLATNNQIITDLWGNCMIVNRITTAILEKAPVAILDTNVLYQVKRYALVYKAMAIGTLSVYWQEFPITTGDKQIFVKRKDALLHAISLLDEAAGIRETSSIFNGALGTEINIRNTINAISARYFTMLGAYDVQYYELARKRASSVPLNSPSVFIYEPLNPNPIWRSGFNSTGGYTSDVNLGLPETLKPDSGDLRNGYYQKTFCRSDSYAIPLYLPGEMLLIQAEAWARKGDAISLDSSKKYLDAVLIKKPSQDPFQLGASLPPYNGAMTQEALLTQIYRNRCIELYMSGQKLEDSRRFERPGVGSANPERNRNYYPYPLQERYGNPNTPPTDPD